MAPVDTCRTVTPDQLWRIGKGGTSFPMFKLRTMVVGAEALLPSLLDRSEGQGPLFKMRDDPRITDVGVCLISSHEC